MQRKSGFTLVEIMIVVAIIAMIAAVALPSFLRARQRAQNVRFVTSIKVAGDAFQMYAMEHNGYPADTGPAQIPAGMAPYLGKFPWVQPTPIGGSWDWDYGIVGVKAAVTGVNPRASVDQQIGIDQMMDDGVGATGILRVTPNRVSYVVEE